MDTVIVENKNRYYFFWEEDTYILTEYSNKKYKVNLNNTKLEDINNFAFNDFFYDNLNQKLFFSYNESTKSYINMLDFGQKRFEQFQILENAFIYTLLKDKAIYKALNSNDQEILIYDLSSKNTTKQINLNNIFSFTGFDLYNVLSFNESENILLNTGVYEDGGLFDAEYYILNIENNTYQNFTIEDYLKDAFPEYGMNINYYSMNKNYAFLNNKLISSDYTFEENVLPLCDYNIKGFVFNEDKLNRLFLLSTLNIKNKEAKKVLVLFECNIKTEILFYKLYHDQIIKKSELVDFDEFNLTLLKNMIYAKHNFAFKDDFLNAYFNLYSFYRYQSENRLENVDHLLTDADKKNLKTIESVLQKK